MEDCATPKPTPGDEATVSLPGERWHGTPTRSAEHHRACPGPSPERVRRSQTP